MRNKHAIYIYSDDAPPPSFDEKMKAGADVNSGVQESMPLIEAHERPWGMATHSTTRGNDNAKT